MPHSASRIFNNEMDMTMINRLAGTRPVINPDIESVHGMIFYFDSSFLVIELQEITTEMTEDDGNDKNSGPDGPLATADAEKDGC